MGGAERLLNRGDMLYLPEGKQPIRIQGAFMADEDAVNLVGYWRKDGAIGSAEIWTDQSEETPDDEVQTPREENEANGDEMLLATIVAEVLPGRETLSISYIQNTYKTAYRRAARIMTMLEERGYVSAPGNRGERRVLTTLANSEEVTADEANV